MSLKKGLTLFGLGLVGIGAGIIIPSYARSYYNSERVEKIRQLENDMSNSKIEELTRDRGYDKMAEINSSKLQEYRNLVEEITPADRYMMNRRNDRVMAFVETAGMISLFAGLYKVGKVGIIKIRCPIFTRRKRKDYWEEDDDQRGEYE